MHEWEFVASRRPAWDRLAGITAKASGPRGLRGLSREEVRSLGPLYRRAASDLAYARAHAISPALVTHINQVVGRTHAVLYQTDTSRWGGLHRFFTHDFPQTFRRRLNFFLAAVGLMLLGTIAGYVMVERNQDNIYLLLPPGSTLHDSVDYWKSGKVTHNIPDAQAAAGASFLMQNNIQVSFVAYAGGMTGGLLTAWAMVMNGAVLGSMSALMTQVHQHHNFWPGILPHGVVELSETAIAGAAGLSIGWALLAPGAYRRRDALVLAAVDSVKLVIGGVFLLVFAGLVEAFFSHSLLPKPLKITFGLVSGIALYSYLFYSGREPTAASAPSPPGTG